MKKLFIFFAFFSFSFSVFSQSGKSISASGYGPTKDEARSEALDALSQSLWTQVQTNLQAEVQASNNPSKGKPSVSRSMEKSVNVTSSLPVIGATYEYTEGTDRKGKSEWQAKVTLSASKSLPSYKAEAEKYARMIDELWASEAKLSESKKDAVFASLSKAYSDYEKYLYITKLLGGSNVAKPSKSSAQFQVEADARAQKATSLDKAAASLVSSIKDSLKNTYVQPAFYEDSKNSTPFSIALASRIKAACGSKLAISKAGAQTFLCGSYYFEDGSVDGDDVCVSYYLCDKDGNVLASCPVVRIPYSVYGTMKFIPSSYNLAKEIQDGRVSSPEFDVSIRVNGSRNPSDFKRGDSLEIEVRATQSCYIYVIGYVYNELGEEFAYLFPMDVYGEGNDMFVRRISPSEVNKWVVINPVTDGGEVANIEVTAPFGEETLQVFAVTTADVNSVFDKIPAWRETDDFYLVTGDPVEASSKTRALAVKKAAKNAAKKEMFADSAVSYTSHD